ncbi:MAG: DUF1598 domain-containing protein [Pirellulaceae bacterium]
MNKRFFAIALAVFATTAILGTNHLCAQGTGTTSQFGGIDVDANGVLSARAFVDNTGRMDRELARAAKDSLNTDIQRPSQLRKVSLKRLESAVQKAMENGGQLPADMQFVAGITRITHVFNMGDDIVIAGPAEGYFVNSQNRVVGTESGESTIHLEDLIVALRAFAPNGRPSKVISVSIDPTAEGSERVSQFAAQLQQNPQSIPGNENLIAQKMKEAMGLQNIVLNGVSPKTRFAQVLTEADYRMKLIGMGLQSTPVRITTYVENMPMVANDALNRWYFQPNYDGVALSSDETSMMLSGSGVELVAEQDRIVNGEKITNAKGANKAARTFAGSFTKNYDKLSAKMTVYGELRNLIDLSVAAAFIQKAGLYEKANWDMSFFGDEAQFPTEKYNEPTQVEPVVTAVWKDGAFSTPVGGGVNIQAFVALRDENIQRDKMSDVETARQQVEMPELDESQWWWD